MVKHTQTIHWQVPTNCLSVFDHFVRFSVFKGYRNGTLVENGSMMSFNRIPPQLFCDFAKNKGLKDI